MYAITCIELRLRQRFQHAEDPASQCVMHEITLLPSLAPVRLDSRIASGIPPRRNG
jgi:hypothetical protein